MVFVYTLSIFLSAFLLFMVQPMVGRIFLPLVGGAPAAWNTCMFFFQLLLLGGYAYTHIAFARLKTGSQMLLHLAFAVGAALTLPVVYRGSGAVPEEPALWLLLQLILTAGLPFLFLSATSPMLQKWFSLSNHARAANPFFLYAASNCGSLAALLAYPILIEPSLGLQEQAELWKYGFYVLVVLMAGCAMLLRRRSEKQVITEESSAAAAGGETLDHGDAAASEAFAASEGKKSEVCDRADTAVSTGRERVWRWITAAAVPSSLLLAVTGFLTRDVAPVPLLWVVPLMLYLITWILAFSEWFSLSTRLIRGAATAGALVFLPLYFLDGTFGVEIGLPAHLFVLFSFSLLCHRYLSETRPSASELTAFYLWLSVGGVVGGMFNSLLAPLLFSSLTEYPLAILAGIYFLQKTGKENDDEAVLQVDGEAAGEAAGRNRFAARRSLLTAAAFSLPFAALIYLIFEIPLQNWLLKLAFYMTIDCSDGIMQSMMALVADYQVGIQFWLCFLSSGIAYFIVSREVRIQKVFFFAMVMLLLFVGWVGKKDPVIFHSRNFFGTKEVIATHKGALHQLVHGDTIHGAQSYIPALKREPLAYYHRQGPVGDIFALPVAQKENLKVCVLGLGPGNAAAWARPGNSFTFIEIDPEIAQIARDPALFSFLADSPARIDVIIGDGRLKMQQLPDGAFDMIILAAFSSDSIPVHLLTVEAIQIYLSKLAPGGIIVANLSNRYLDLASLIAVTAKKCGLECTGVSDHVFDATAGANFMRMPSIYAVMARPGTELPAAKAPYRLKWEKLRARAGVEAWTDDFHSLFALFHLDALEFNAD